MHFRALSRSDKQPDFLCQATKVRYEYGCYLAYRHVYILYKEQLRRLLYANYGVFVEVFLERRILSNK